MRPKLLLLVGATGVGKNTLIAHLSALDSRFILIPTYTTRQSRHNETEKISVSDETMDMMLANGELLEPNIIYNHRYATPKHMIVETLNKDSFPVTDWVIFQERMQLMRAFLGDRLFTVYVSPPSLEHLKERLSADGRDKDGKRFRIASDELRRFSAGEFEGFYDLQVVNDHGQQGECATTILTAYSRAIT